MVAEGSSLWPAEVGHGAVRDVAQDGLGAAGEALRRLVTAGRAGLKNIEGIE